MKDLFDISDVMRSADVYRWHAVKTLRQQSNAEHSWLVACIADTLSKRIYPDMNEREQLLLLRISVFHDIAEAQTGDIASPVKRVLDAHFATKGEENPLDELEAQLCPGYSLLKSQIKGTPIRRILKMADLIEMIAFIATEGVGSYAKRIEENLRRGLAELIETSYQKYPELNWSAGDDLLEEIFEEQGNTIEFQWRMNSL